MSTKPDISSCLRTFLRFYTFWKSRNSLGFDPISTRFAQANQDCMRNKTQENPLHTVSGSASRGRQNHPFCPNFQMAISQSYFQLSASTFQGWCNIRPRTHLRRKNIFSTLRPLVAIEIEVFCVSTSSSGCVSPTSLKPSPEYSQHFDVAAQLIFWLLAKGRGRGGATKSRVLPWQLIWL